MRRNPSVVMGTTHDAAPTMEYGGVVEPTKREFLMFVADNTLVFARRVVVPAQGDFRAGVDEARIPALNAIAKKVRAEFQVTR